ncbi:MAG: CoA pyrophosphatase [Deltaproteobacteria bacterium]|nr:CoA pyrophosphatase [Deltaproteobacteria bacterium]
MSALRVDEIRRRLGAHAPSILAPTAKHAAVAAVLHDTGAGSELLFIERAEHPYDPWSGHMAFPGGRVDPDDASARHAAERETLEEVGLDLGSAELLGRLDDVEGAPPGFDSLVVSAFVYHLDRRITATPNYEVRDVLWVPTAHLEDRARRIPFYWPRQQRDVHYPGILVGQPDRHVVWGLTYRFLELFFVALGRQL